MKVLVTGADGFVGGWMIRELLQAGEVVTGAIRAGTAPPSLLSDAERGRVDWVDFDLASPDSVTSLAQRPIDAVVHLAALASGAEARRDPGNAWAVNAAGTARLAEALGSIAGTDRAAPRLLVVSTGEVYGHGGRRPLGEDHPPVPASPYAASKLGAEIAAAEVGRRTGLPVIVARAFPHTGPGQTDRYVVPALAQRIRTARRIKAPAIKTGNLDVVRDFLDVRDVATAYRLLLQSGRAGVTYNVASGTGLSLRDVVGQLMELLGYRVILETDPTLARANDLRFLVGKATRLAADTGWTPRFSFRETLKDLLDAQAD